MPSHAKRQSRHRRQGTPRFTEPALKELEPKVQQTINAAIAAALNAIQTVPVGAMFPYGGSVAPEGYFLAQGQTFVAADYPQLAAVVGTTFGGTATNPRLPDTQSNVVVGVDFSNGWTPGSVFGSDTQTLVLAHMPAHSHGGTLTTDNPGAHNHAIGLARQVNTTTGGTAGRVTSGGSDISINSDNGGGHTHDVTLASQGSDAAHNNIQPTIAMYWIIKHD